MSITAERYHDICTGHRVFNQGSKCEHAHGHNYRIHFQIKASDKVDSVGRVLDFSDIKSALCFWLEDNWDHKFLLWENDPWSGPMQALDPNGVVLVPFNPTAENMAEYLLTVIGPQQLPARTQLVSVRIEETAKCSATATHS